MNKVTNLISRRNVLLNMEFSSKDDVLKHIATHFVEQGHASSVELVLAEMYKREAMGATIIDTHLAMPHAKSKDITNAGIVILRLVKPVIWDLETKEEISLVIMLGLTDQHNDLHIEVISEISQVLLEEDGIRKLLNFGTTQEIVHFLDKGVYSLENDNS